MKIRGAKYLWIWILLLSPNLFWLIHRSSNLSCNLLSCWSPNMAYLLTELESLINIRVLVLQVFFLEHLESSDLNICSKSYDLNIKTCTVWIRIFLSFIFILWCKQPCSNRSPSLSSSFSNCNFCTWACTWAFWGFWALFRLYSLFK